MKLKGIWALIHAQVRPYVDDVYVHDYNEVKYRFTDTHIIAYADDGTMYGLDETDNIVILDENDKPYRNVDNYSVYVEDLFMDLLV